MIEDENLKSIRNKHLSEILDMLRRNEACSLAKLAENTDSGLTTVKKCVMQMTEENMVLEGDIAPSTGGRKARQYLINKDYQYFLFLIVDNNGLLCRVYNFRYSLCDEYSVRFEMNEYLSAVHKIIDSVKSKYNLGTVCLSVPCVIKNGTVMSWYYNRSLEGYNIKQDIEKKYGLNVIVQNDMKLTVTGERRQGIKDIVTIQFGHNGIGLGAMINGHLVEGCVGFAGEVGFTNDLQKNIMGVSYPAKIVRNAIIFLNPELIVFYKSQRQNNFEQIFHTAVRGLPKYAIPKIQVSDSYIGSINCGFKALIDKYGYFRRSEDENL